MGEAAEFDPLRAHDPLHGVQLANQITVLVSPGHKPRILCTDRITDPRKGLPGY